MDLFTNGAKAGAKERHWKSVNASEDDIAAQLISSAFDIQGISKIKKGTPYPLHFDWTVSPKIEGRHDLLLDLSEITHNAREDSAGGGATDVQIGDRKVELKDGVGLPLQIEVTGLFGLPKTIANAVISLPALLGFILNYPIFLDWLRKRRERNTRD